ncbi:hypothetical protein WMY93_007160 [Mugilogobius chulae]|uniref:Scaffolding anchor of CK1 domain-containing protein n=1 Tax=Mugilogobius chulae TaxID=88201 RepID=A0AAW0PLU0_9GOBI
MVENQDVRIQQLRFCMVLREDQPSMVQVITGHLVKSYDEEFRTLYARSTVPAKLAPSTSLNGLQGRPIIPKPVPILAPKLERGGHLRHTMEGVYRKSCERTVGLAELQESRFEEESLGPLIENGINAHISAEINKKRHSYAGERQDGYIPPNLRPRGSNWNVSGDSGKNSALDNFLPVAQIRSQPKRQMYTSKDKLIPVQTIMPNQESSKAFMRTWRIESYLNNTDTPLRESCQLYQTAELSNSSFGLGRLSPNTAMQYSSMQWSPTAADRMGKEEFSFKQQSLQMLDDNENFSPARSPHYPNYASLGRPKGPHILNNPEIFTENWHKRHSVADPRSNSNYIHEEQLSSMGINAPNGGYLSALNEDQRSISHYDVKNITSGVCSALDVNTEDLNNKGSNTNKQRFFKKSSKKIKSLLNIQDKNDSEETTPSKHKQHRQDNSERHRNQRTEDPLATSKPRFTTEEHQYYPQSSNVKYIPQRQLSSPERSSKLSYETGSFKREYNEQKKYSRYEPSYVKIQPVRSASAYGSKQVQEKHLSKREAPAERQQAAHGNQENKFGKFIQRELLNLVNKQETLLKPFLSFDDNIFPGCHSVQLSAAVMLAIRHTCNADIAHTARKGPRKGGGQSLFCHTSQGMTRAAVDKSHFSAGMVVDWEQDTGLLMTSGDVRVIRIWDTDREMKVQAELQGATAGTALFKTNDLQLGEEEVVDIPTGADSCVTSLSCDSQRSLIVAGLGDGSVRVFDRRMGPTSAV